MLHRLPLFLVLCVGSLWTTAAAADNRDLLWRVVQACVLNHSITGTAFPCLFVDTSNGLQRGFAVVRAPNDRTRIVITPTVRTIGIESERLRGADAPNYFHDAWISRRFMTADLGSVPPRGDLAMAINSRLGRSQDQLHIHVACIRADVKASVARQRHRIREDAWTPLKVLPNVPRYWARFEANEDLAGDNIFDAVAYGLKVDAGRMDDVTIVVIGDEAASDRGPGFIVLARKRVPHGFDLPHGEGLLDPACAAFRGSKS